MAERPPVPTEVVDACARGMLARERAHRRAVQGRAVELCRQAERAAHLLGNGYGVRRVWLFGSLAWGAPHQASDVDLLVEGLEEDGSAAAVTDVERLVRVPVDLIRVEDASAGLIERVRAEGMLLHDAG